jgi:hypothetical protein
MHKEKAHGHDSYIGIFFKECWSLIKDDILAAINQFYNMNQHDLQFLNQAMVVLIPKKYQPKNITDLRPISLIHSFAKLLSKLLANRLAPELKKLISHNQNAFIKKSCIRDNFMFVHQMIKELHRKNVSTIFMKIDISKAFYTVS